MIFWSKGMKVSCVCYWPRARFRASLVRADSVGELLSPLSAWAPA